MFARTNRNATASSNSNPARTPGQPRRYRSGLANTRHLSRDW
jgi:hypothetical protein